MPEFPPLNHVALTVRDLAISVPWYEALFDAEPVIDEDTDPDMHHTVYLLGNGTLPPWIGLWWVHVPMLLLAAWLFARDGRLPMQAKARS